MSGNDAIPNSDWVRLNVGGKIFQTTKDTLSRFPESFLARLVNGYLPSDKDESGAYLLDSDPEYFRIILNYLRRGVLNLDDNKLTMKGLLTEADFLNIEPLIGEIHKDLKIADHRTELVVITEELLCIYPLVNGNWPYVFVIVPSETQNDYDVLNALRQKLSIECTADGKYYVRTRNLENWSIIEATLRSFDFVEEFKGKWDVTDGGKPCTNDVWKFGRKALGRSINKRTELVIIVAYRAEILITGASHSEFYDAFGIVTSEAQENYEILRVLRQKIPIAIDRNGRPYVRERSMHHWTIIEATLRSYGFAEEFRGKWWDNDRMKDIWKFARTINE